MCARVHSQDAQLWKGGGNWGMAPKRAPAYARERIYAPAHIYTYLQQCLEIEGGSDSPPLPIGRKN